MGCGCSGSSSTLSTTKSQAVTLSKCPELQEVLRALDLRVLNLLAVQQTALLLETNRQLRFWMRNLNKYCPTEEEIDTVTQFVSNEENK